MISIQEAHQLGQNNASFRVKLTLYNGIELYCIPIMFHEHKGVLKVAELHSKADIDVRRDTIYKWEQLAVYTSNDIFPIQSPTYTGEHAKKLIIIGAGASFGYSPSPRKPEMPLANNIFHSDFNDVLNGFQGAKNFSTSSSHYLNDLEAFFQKQWDRVKRYDVYDTPTVSNLISMQYYLSRLFLHLSDVQKGNRHNHYNHLVQLVNTYLSDKAINEKVLIVSFNYDTLMEEAITNVLSQKFETTDDYIDFHKNRLLLFKPHGSGNWFRKSSLLRAKPLELDEALAESAKSLLSRGTSLGELIDSLSEEINIIDHSNFKSDRMEFKHYPQLLIPFKDKDDFAMPSSHVNVMNNLLDKIEDVLVIG